MDNKKIKVIVVGKNCGMSYLELHLMRFIK